MFASSFAFSENAFGPRRSGKGGLPPSSMTTTKQKTKQKTRAKKTNLLNERERKRSKRRTLRVVKAFDDESDENNDMSVAVTRGDWMFEFRLYG